MAHNDEAHRKKPKNRSDLVSQSLEEAESGTPEPMHLPAPITGDLHHSQAAQAYGSLREPEDTPVIPVNQGKTHPRQLQKVSAAGKTERAKNRQATAPRQPGGKPRASQAGVSPKTNNPTTGTATLPLDVGSQRIKASQSAMKTLRRFVAGEAPPTAPMSIVDRLAGSPYANPMVQVGGLDKSAQLSLDFTLLLAETMFRYGANALDVENAIVSVMAAFGLRNMEVDITNQAVIINYTPKDSQPLTVVRVVRSWTNNYAGLAAVHRLVTEIISGNLNRQEAERKLRQILHQPKPFPRWLVSVCNGLFAGCVIAVLGGGWNSILAGTLATYLVALFGKILSNWRIPEFFTTAISSFLITAVALALVGSNLLGGGIDPGIIVTGGILLLLPTGRLVSSVQDAISGFPVTAAGRILSSLFIFGALVGGIAVASTLGRLMGINSKVISDSVGSAMEANLGIILLIVAFATITIGVAEQTEFRLLIPTALVGTFGYFVLLLSNYVGIGPRLGPILAAAVIGFAARIVALRLGAPQVVIGVPSILFLLTGLSIFRAMFALTTDSDVSLAGVVGLFNALVVILGVASGVVFGDILARPLSKTWSGARKVRRR